MEITFTLDLFEDILEPRRKELSNLIWIARGLNTIVPYKHDIKIGSEQLKEEVLKSIKFQEFIQKISKDQHVPIYVLNEQTVKILEEIGYTRNIKVIRFLGLLITKICSKVCAGIYINKENLLQLKIQMGTAPVIYLPSHRSYADFILMSYICFHYGIEIPAIAAGMDFHRMWAMGSVLRDTGAFFMRRSYNDDDLYWKTFQEYVHQLVVKGHVGLEFFIEGTRSRSGKSLSPKYGLLSMVLRAFFNGEVPDILFVPINISYDKVMEENLFAFELLGVPKPKESTTAFVKSLSLVKEKYGNVYVNFGNPISAFNFFRDKIDRSVHNLRPIHSHIITESEKQNTSILAQEIINKQQKLCVLSTFNLIAVVLTNNLMNKDLPLSIEKLMQELIWLQLIIVKLGAVTNFKNKKSLVNALDVHQNLVKINESEEVHLVQNEIILDKFNLSQLKGHLLTPKTMTVSVPLMMLQLYVNPTLHYFINSSIVAAILKKSPDMNLNKDKLFEDYCFLRSVFCKEFTLFQSRRDKEFNDTITQLEDLKVIKFNNNTIGINENQKLQQLLCNLIEPFIFTYYVVCGVLRMLGKMEFTEKNIMVKSQYHIENYINNNRFIHPYTLSLDTISNCLNSLVERNAVSRIKKKSSVLYQVNVEITSFVEHELHEYLVELVGTLDLDAHLSNKL